MNQKKIMPAEFNSSLRSLDKIYWESKISASYMRKGRSKTSSYQIERYPIPDKMNRKCKWSELRTRVPGSRSSIESGAAE